MRFAIRWMMMVVMCAPLVRAADNRTDQELLEQTQAADIVSELLTYYGDLANARIYAMRSYLEENKQLESYDIRKPAVDKPKRLTFAEAFNGAILFVQQGGAKYADPALKELSPDQLRREFDALQHYNLQQFLHLNIQRDEADRLRKHLENLGEFEGYIAWAQQQDSPAGIAASQPVASTQKTSRDPQAVADWMDSQVVVIKQRAWEKAEKDGMSREEFEKQWAEKVAGLRENVNERITAVKTLGQYFHTRAAEPVRQANADAPASPAGAGPRIPAPAVNVAPTPLSGTPITRQDPRWQADYYGPNDPYNSWSDSYQDVYSPSGGGGVYRRYDTRLNDNYDMRVQGEIDRRANVGHDRRLNIRVDPRVNY